MKIFSAQIFLTHIHIGFSVSEPSVIHLLFSFAFFRVHDSVDFGFLNQKYWTFNTVAVVWNVVLLFGTGLWSCTFVWNSGEASIEWLNHLLFIVAIEWIMDSPFFFFAVVDSLAFYWIVNSLTSLTNGLDYYYGNKKETTSNFWYAIFCSRIIKHRDT